MTLTNSKVSGKPDFNFLLMARTLPSVYDECMKLLRLQELRASKGLSQEDVADKLDISVPYLSQLENERKEISTRLLKKFADLYKVDVADLFTSRDAVTSAGHPVQRITVVGEVAAGQWVESMEWDDEDQYEVVAPLLPDHYKNAFGALVKGDSMNKHYPPGSIVICVPIHDYSGEIKDGQHVICQRIRHDGQIEATIKEFQRADDGHLLWPRSTNPKWSQPIYVPKLGFHDGHEEYVNDIKEVTVTAVVIGSFKWA